MLTEPHEVFAFAFGWIWKQTVVILYPGVTLEKCIIASYSGIGTQGAIAELAPAIIGFLLLDIHLPKHSKNPFPFRPDAFTFLIAESAL